MANGLFGGGNGTSANPYLIEDFADLEAVRYFVGLPNLYFKQVAPITFDKNADPWKPIGGVDAPPFMSNYNGDLHPIFDLAVEGVEGSPTGGLFGWLSPEGRLSNIILHNAKVDGYSDTGGIVGKLEGRIEKSSFQGTVNGTTNVGGLVGVALNNITGCSAKGTVAGDSNVGGLVGLMDPTNTNRVTFIECITDAKVSAAVDFAGGVVGSYFYIANSLLYVEYTFALGTVESAGTNVSGIAGNAMDANAVTRYKYALYNTELTGITDYKKSSSSGALGMEGRTAEDFKNPILFVDFSRDYWLWNYEAERKQMRYEFLYKVFDQGEGTESNPYLITSIEDFRKIEEIIPATGVHFKLVADLDFSSIDVWESIGDWNTKGFAGVFDGNGRKISNMNIVARDYIWSGVGAGLFGKLTQGAHVKNVTMNNITLAGEGYLGAIAGIAGGRFETGTVTVSNCTLDGVTINDTMGYSGGFVGMPTNLIIEDCEGKNIVVNSPEYSGGMLGSCSGTTRIANCNVQAKVIDTNDSGWGCQGGVVGIAGTPFTMLDTHADVEVIGSTGYSRSVGGLVGTAGGYCEVTRCSVKGIVKGRRDVGSVFGTHSIRDDIQSVATDVLADCVVEIFAMNGAGLIGSVDSINLSNCIFIGSVVSVNAGDEDNNIRPVLGYIDPIRMKIKNVFYNVDIVSVPIDSRGIAIPKNTLELANTSTYVGFDLDNIWNITVDGPALVIENRTGEPTPPDNPVENPDDDIPIDDRDIAIITNVDFTQTEILVDRLGNPVPQVWDHQRKQWIPVTLQMMVFMGNS